MKAGGLQVHGQSGIHGDTLSQHHPCSLTKKTIGIDLGKKTLKRATSKHSFFLLWFFDVILLLFLCLRESGTFHGRVCALMNALAFSTCPSYQVLPILSVSEILFINYYPIKIGLDSNKI